MENKMEMVVRDALDADREEAAEVAVAEAVEVEEEMIILKEIEKIAAQRLQTVTEIGIKMTEMQAVAGEEIAEAEVAEITLKKLKMIGETVETSLSTLVVMEKEHRVVDVVVEEEEAAETVTVVDKTTQMMPTEEVVDPSVVVVGDVEAMKAVTENVVTITVETAEIVEIVETVEIVEIAEIVNKTIEEDKEEMEMIENLVKTVDSVEEVVAAAVVAQEEDAVAVMATVVDTEAAILVIRFVLLTLSMT